MKTVPRILPIVGVAMGGVLAVNALSGAQGLPELLSGARAFAEEAVGGKGVPAEAPAEDVLPLSSIVLDGAATTAADAITEAGRLLVTAGAVESAY
ncbi:MAG TPA: hypothetical protein PKB04_02960, partial [Phenylobacterium sp.]|nr:hypothetical protein [Phenylobacterium sp.]